MLIVYIIGFRYNDSPDSKNPKRVYLPGIIVDLYQVYNIFNKIHPDKIVIITDIDENVSIDIVLEAIKQEKIDAHVLSFISSLKSDKKYIQFLSKEKFLSDIKNTISGYDKIFIYYTGHVDSGSILLPVPKLINSRNNHSHHNIENIDSLINPNVKSDLNLETKIELDLSTGSNSKSIPILNPNLNSSSDFISNPEILPIESTPRLETSPRLVLNPVPEINTDSKSNPRNSESNPMSKVETIFTFNPKFKSPLPPKQVIPVSPGSMPFLDLLSNPEINRASSPSQEPFSNPIFSSISDFFSTSESSPKTEVNFTSSESEKKSERTSLSKLEISKYSFASKGNNNVQKNSNEDILLSNEFMSTIVDNSDEKCEIIIIMDCCMSDGLNLPYVLKDGVYRRNNNGKMEYGYYTDKKILLITSTLPDQSSIATSSGSIFTGILCKNILHGKKSLEKLIATVQENTAKTYKQTPTIYVNNPNIKSLFNFMFPNELFKVEFLQDLSVIEIKYLE